MVAYTKTFYNQFFENHPDYRSLKFDPMKKQVFGGNTVESFDLATPGKHLFGEGPYSYFHVRTAPGTPIDIRGLRSFTVYFLELPPGAAAAVDGVGSVLKTGDAVVEDADPSCEVDSAARSCLGVAGPCRRSRRGSGTQLPPCIAWSSPGPRIMAEQATLVSLKQIFVKAGRRPPSTTTQGGTNALWCGAHTTRRRPCRATR